MPAETALWAPGSCQALQKPGSGQALTTAPLRAPPITAELTKDAKVPKRRVKSCAGKSEQACKNILISLCESGKATVHNSQEPTCSALG